MAVRQGKTSPKELRLHVALTTLPSNASRVMDEAKGLVAREGKRRLGGAAIEPSVKSALAGRKIADADLQAVAENAAQRAMRLYSKEGFDIPVKPVRVGSGWRIVVDGGERDQKWSRIIETGYAPQDTHQFIRMASKKRALKLKKKGDIPGFYLIIPKVHGKVTLTKKGKMTFTPKRDSRLGSFGVAPEDLKQFEATPKEIGVAANFEEEDPSIYGQDTRAKRYTRYNSAGELTSEKDHRGRNEAIYKGKREAIVDNHHWEVDRMAQAVRKAGAIIEMREESGKKSSRYSRQNAAGEILSGRSNRQGARVIERLNRREVDGKLAKTRVNNLRFVSPTADYADLDEDNESRQRMVAKRGDVLSFITLSTRKNLAPRPGRSGKFVMRKTREMMVKEIRSLIKKAEAEKREGFEREAYLEVVRSALGIAGG